ncbi:hypothetical protein PIROE2DRAFT_9322 [Piromyces sp. E2]|nr:hypothetical protein PIROE2DRAFT_9322 [Piromyces sp. E2]|eukprot:OUM64019.1 hypothetical protein PIROE2DRAFT_9322 [Piromyces sp. E2]
MSNQVVRRRHNRVGSFPNYGNVALWGLTVAQRNMLRRGARRPVIARIRNNMLTKVNVIYFIGKPGHGKTYNAYLHAFNMGYSNEDITKVTINNNFFEFNIQFTDKYGYSCPIKGGHKYVKPETIIICSIIDPRRLYREEKELNEQFTRRINHLYEVQNDHSYVEILLNQICIGGRPIGFRTDFNQLEEYEVTDDWDGTRTIIM